MKLSLNAPGGRIVSLPAEAVLREIPVGVSRHEEFGRRHPSAAYSVSIAAVADRLDDVLERLPIALDSSERVDSLLRAQEALLQVMREHLEACGGVLKSLVPDPSRFLKNRHVRQFNGATRDYKDHVGRASNPIRHEGRRLAMISATCADATFGGYFIEAPLPNNTVGPEPTIHQDGLTAFSFNRDLKFHACSLLHVSERLRIAVAGLCPSTPMLPTALSEHRLAGTIERIANLGETYFPDEYEKPRPVLVFSEGGASGSRLQVEFVSSDGWRPFAGQTFRVTLRYRADGMTNSWKVPYTQPQYKSTLGPPA